jgi:hypothetical protein
LVGNAVAKPRLEQLNKDRPSLSNLPFPTQPAFPGGARQIHPDELLVLSERCRNPSRLVLRDVGFYNVGRRALARARTTAEVWITFKGTSNVRSRTTSSYFPFMVRQILPVALAEPTGRFRR